ncbi:MAG: hypothetical protein AB8G26_00650, partial [Ilumatobacter sp.]
MTDDRALPPPSGPAASPPIGAGLAPPTESPWATDDIPPSSGLAGLEWSGVEQRTSPLPPPDPTTRADPLVAASPPGASLDGGSVAGARDEDIWIGVDQQPDDEMPEPTRDRSGWVVAGAVAAVIALAVGVLSWTGDDGDDADADQTSTTLAELPEASTTTSTTTTSTTEPNRLDDDAADGSGDPGPSVSYVRVPLPDAVAAIEQPTEAVVLSTAGEVVTIAVPTGIAQIVRIPGTGPGESQISVTPTFTLVSTGNELFVLRPDGTVLPVDGDELSDGSNVFGIEIAQGGWSRRADGTDVAFVRLFGTADVRSVAIDIDGAVTVDEVIDPNRFVLSQGGRRVVIDAGGSYLLDELGNARRITDGFTFAINEQFALQRRCDEALQCVDGVADLDSGEFRVTNLSVENGFFGAASISPDGEALSIIDQQTGRRQLVEIGQEASGGINADGFGDGWVADSSGELLLRAQQLVFHSRDGGAVTEIPLDVGGRLLSIGVRRNESFDAFAAEQQIDAPTDVMSGLQLVAIGADGLASFVDIDRRSADSWEIPTIDRLLPPSIEVQGETVVVRSGNPSDGGFTTSFGVVTEVIDGVDMPDSNGPTLPGSDVIGSVGDDRVIATVDGEIVLLDDGTFPLTRNDLLAFGGRFALTQTCDDSACTQSIVDAYAGTDAAVKPRLDAVVPTAATSTRTAALTDTVAPDGSAALIEVRILVDGEQPLDRWALIELDGSAP